MINVINLTRRLFSALIAGGVVFSTLYLGTRFDVQWIVGILILFAAYPAGVEYIQLMKRLQIPIAAPEFLIWIPILVFSTVIFNGRYSVVALLLAITYQVLRYLGSLPHRDGFLKAVAGVFGLLYIPWPLTFLYQIYISGGDRPAVGASNALIIL
ncbi:MAG TPA: hypothetical protein ENL23_05750, partial [Candidatus Acetothermia bacterium]|nr:hypothetical protein [Candidatus Acetothermia bacterium]